MSQLPPKCQKLRISCDSCSLAGLCLPVGLELEEIQRLDTLIKKRRVVKRGEHLFREGQSFSRLFSVRSGSFKSYKINGEGELRIIGFYLPGELIGFHGLHGKQYAVSLVALETSSVCEIPFDELLNFAGHLPTLQRNVMELMSEQLSPNYMLDPNSSAEQRVAKFLLGISTRLSRRGLSTHAFNLSMSRQDIGNYLGLAPETVSRIFSHLQDVKALSINRREVHILQMRQLQAMACSHC